MDRDTYMNGSMIGEIGKLSPGLEMGEPGKTCLFASVLEFSQCFHTLSHLVRITLCGKL